MDAGHRPRNRTGIKIRERFLCDVRKRRSDTEMLEMSLFEKETALCLERGAWSVVKWRRQATSAHAFRPRSNGVGWTMPHPGFETVVFSLHEMRLFPDRVDIKHI